MWDPNGSLLQVEVGQAVSAAATKPDGRGLLAKMTGAPSPILGQRLVEATETVRSQLLQGRGIVMPPVDYRTDSQLPPDLAVFYIGLERRSYRLRNIEEVQSVLVQRVCDIGSSRLDRNAARTLLSAALSSVRDDEYQQAFEHYCRVYYHGVMGGFDFEVARSLCDVGNIYLLNADVPFAAVLLGRAHEISRTQPVVDVVLKPQIALNLANVLRLLNRHGEALAYYQLASNDAYFSNNPVLLFLALTGAAEVHYWSHNYAAAVRLLEQAHTLVAEVPSAHPYELAYQVERSMNVILSEAAAASTAASARRRDDVFEDLKRRLPVALLESLVSTAVCKLFSAGGGLSLSLFGVANYNLKSSVFQGAVAIGKDIAQNIG